MEKVNIKGDRYYKVKDNLYPSVTTILKYYPKGEPFYKWISGVGYEEANKIRDNAGEQGNNVHRAIEEYVKHSQVNNMGELSDKERELFNNFVSWYNDLSVGTTVNVVAQELSVCNDKHQYAGTIDLILEVSGELWIIDIKTSNYVHKTHQLQLSAYKHCGYEEARLGILHLKSNRFIEVEDSFDVFLSVKNIFDFEQESVF